MFKPGWIQLSSGEDVELASIERRIGARVLDLVILVFGAGFVIQLLSQLAAALFSADETGEPGPFVNTVALVAFLVIFVGYEVVLVAVRGQTLGKQMLGIKVIRAVDGGLPEGRKALSRSVVFWLVFWLRLLVPILVLLIWFIRVRRAHIYRGWHDKVSGTLVVSTRTREVPRPTTNPFAAPPAE